ncbi:MAG: ATP-binding protein [Bacteroidetes bacterium]|nr:ATP-binding protein [Bacteroidota bacterium]
MLREYLSVGGFPEVYKFGKSILHRLFNDIITKDILLRHKIKKSNEIKMLANYLITNFTGEISYSRMVKLFNIKHVSTLSKWLSYLEESFLIFKLQRFSFKLKEQYLATKKVFAIDNGIILSTGFLFGENSGKLMENCVAVELQRKVAEQPGMEIYYWKDYRQHEVDFIIKNAKHVEQLIQVTWATTKEEIKEREVKSLVIACDELYCRNLLIITWDYESEAKISGKKITFIPLWKWLTG